jgi:thioester reductase-like protein
MPSYFLLTGATGLLGRYLTRNLLLEGADVAVLVRPSRRKSAEMRVESMMRCWEEILGIGVPRPKVLTGDINEPDLGLSLEEIKWVSESCRAVIHNAASLSFVTTGPNAEPWKSNVQGTRNVLSFCEQAGIRDLHHVSTAYISGLRQGRIYEADVNVGQEFANCYEESKIQAEELVRASTRLNSLTVYRPGIIIGDSQTSMTTTFHNFYALLQIALMLGRRDEIIDFTGKSNGTHTRFNLDGHERKNLVPVDWVGDVMTHIVLAPQHHGKTYHLTPPIPVTMRLMKDVLEESIGIYGVQFEGAGDRRANLSETEALFFDYMKVYESYWRDDPAFDTTNTRGAAPHLPCPHVDRQMLLRMAKVAIDSRFSWKDPAVERVPDLSVV